MWGSVEEWEQAVARKSKRNGYLCYPYFTCFLKGNIFSLKILSPVITFNFRSNPKPFFFKLYILSANSLFNSIDPKWLTNSKPKELRPVFVQLRAPGSPPPPADVPAGHHLYTKAVTTGSCSRQDGHKSPWLYRLWKSCPCFRGKWC